MSLILICVMSCMRSQTPYNLILLYTFTVFEAYCIGAISSLYNVRSVFIAFTLTAAIFSGITAYVHITKRDFSFMYAGAFGALLALVMVSFIGMFWPSPLLQLILAWVGAVIFTVLILVDTSRLLHESIDDWAFAAVSLYLDFINLFIRMLQIVGVSDRS